MSKQPIGVFDSGLGGTSIWKEIHSLIPNEDYIYLADSANAPYGPKGKDAIIALSIKNTEFLLKKECKLIVVACNTATTNAIDYLRNTYNVPFIGIEPAIKPAALQTKTNAIGILATKGTLSSELFSKTSNLFTSNINVIEQVGNGIVELIESGKLQSDEMVSLLKIYLKPMIDANIDYLVLGCTHYPYLIPLLIDLLPKHVKIIDSGEAVARQTKAVLEKNNLLNTILKKPKNEFYTNGNPEIMESLLENNFKVENLNF
ncbi:MAG: glutamate racemase [Flaviramulus sp.]|nr:glutamate racemase [Flaviramulus sp.]NNC50257.1 glutamate racemase [Flaviramulus sp.]